MYCSLNLPVLIASQDSLRVLKNKINLLYFLVHYKTGHTSILSQIVEAILRGHPWEMGGGQLGLLFFEYFFYHQVNFLETYKLWKLCDFSGKMLMIWPMTPERKDNKIMLF